MQALRDKTLQTEDLETAQEYLERLEVTHPWTAPDGRVTDRSGTWSNATKPLRSPSLNGKRNLRQKITLSLSLRTPTATRIDWIS